MIFKCTAANFQKKTSIEDSAKLRAGRDGMLPFLFLVMLENDVSKEENLRE